MAETKQQIHPKVAWAGVIAVHTLLVSACTADISRPTTTTSSRPTLQSVPDVTRLTASNCSGTASTSPPQLLGSYFNIRYAPNWTKTSDSKRTETLLLELTAPQTYLSAPTTIQFHSDLGAVHTAY